MIMKSCRYVYLKPQRCVNLTFDEEQRRLHRTWQSWDRHLWEVVQNDKEIIGQFAIDVDRYREQVSRGDLVLGFSDQVPWWGFVQMPKQLCPYSVNRVGWLVVWLIFRHAGGGVF